MVFGPSGIPEGEMSADCSGGPHRASGLLSDLRHGVTLIRRDAWTSALIIGVLALGIGGTTATFTLFKAAFLDSLPFRDAERLVAIYEQGRRNPSASEFLELRGRASTIDQIGFAQHTDMQLSGGEGPLRVYVARVTASLFPLLGVTASLGRTFLGEENAAGRNSTVVLSDGFWRNQMGADPDVLGRTLWLDGAPVEIVGVLAPRAHFDYPTLQIPERVDIYVPFALENAGPVANTGSGLGTPVLVLGHLRKGIPFDQAAAEMDTIGRALVQERPDVYKSRDGGPSDFTFVAVPLREAIVGSQKSLLWLLAGGSGVLLLIVSANTAQLLLARALRRKRELAIRAAVGASRASLVRLFLCEGFVLAVCGSAAGLAAAAGILRVLIAMLPVRSPVLASAQLGANVAGFSLAASVSTAMIAAILPAAKSSGQLPGPSLGARGTAGEGNRLRHTMIAIEAGLSVFLLCGAGIVVSNLWTLVSAPMGFDPDDVLAMRIKLPAQEQRQMGADTAAFELYLERIKAIPGVVSAATVTGPPLRPAIGGPLEIAGVTEASGELRTVISMTNQVTPGYFKTMGIPLLAGRAFETDDRKGHPLVAIVNQEAARRFGLGTNVVGRQIWEPGEPITIVGLVGNVRVQGQNAAPFPEVYLSSMQIAWSNVYLVVRSQLPQAQLVQQIRSAIESSNPQQAVYGVMTMDELISDAVTEPRFHVFLTGAFATLAMFTTASGLYGVISLLSAQRTTEIAIRLAMGATRGDIARNIAAGTMAWVAAGITAGVGAGLAMGDTIRSLTNVASPPSYEVYFWVAGLFLLVAVAAVYRPVLKATRVDPGTALKVG